MKITDLYESEFLTNKDEILTWMENSFNGFNPSKLKIEPDGLVYQWHLKLNQNIPELKVQFKLINNYFEINLCQITSLKGSPEIVGAGFYCNNTNITSLEGCPETVGGDFDCSYNNIDSLKGIPKYIGLSFYSDNIKITDPKEYRWALYSEINGTFHSNNTDISDIINTYNGAENKKHWPKAINLLSKVKL